MSNEKKNVKFADLDEQMKKEVQSYLKRQERKRKIIVILCSLVAVFSIGYFCFYYYLDGKNGNQYQGLSELKTNQMVNSNITIHHSSLEIPDVLEEYKSLYNKNKSLIGWIKIDDTNIDYPVMQSKSNDYYLDHNYEQEYDKNGSIFMDSSCDVLKPSTNLIIYGHNMKSGKMFGSLSKYENKAYYTKHPYIQFDTIYGKGTYAIVYVFRSRIYYEDEITFKYYQFTDVNSEAEFNSAMSAMEELSLYDTGIEITYGDQLITLSTCDYEEEDGRFVVVAKKLK